MELSLAGTDLSLAGNDLSLAITDAEVLFGCGFQKKFYRTYQLDVLCHMQADSSFSQDNRADSTTHNVQDVGKPAAALPRLLLHPFPYSRTLCQVFSLARPIMCPPTHELSTATAFVFISTRTT
jgi:hypothetical protein